MRRRLSIVTVGCKANFADSAAIVIRAARAGFEVVRPGEPADVLIVNGCTVTHRADRDCRALARRLRREHPSAVLVMTGCFAETTADDRSALPEVDHWIGIREVAALPSLLDSLAGDERKPAGEDLSEYAADLLLGRSRTFIKIQDGCDASCAYCIVPAARGPGRSISLRRVVEQAARAESEGAAEIVLTGIHAGRYGAERGERDGLASLLEALLKATSACRFRLGSVEPLEITARIVSLVSGEERICPHLHVPLQSGSDGVLVRMRRPYTARQYRERLAMLASEAPGIRLGADVITGFPGETRDDFEETVRAVGGTPLSYLHVFPYSPRKGTESAGWKDDVTATEKKRRTARLRAMDFEMRKDYLEIQVGKTLTVAVESNDPNSGELGGTTENYIEAIFRPKAGTAGNLVRVRIDAVRGDRLHGTVV